MADSLQRSKSSWQTRVPVNSEVEVVAVAALVVGVAVVGLMPSTRKHKFAHQNQFRILEGKERCKVMLWGRNERVYDANNSPTDLSLSVSFILAHFLVQCLVWHCHLSRTI